MNSNGGAAAISPIGSDVYESASSAFSTPIIGNEIQRIEEAAFQDEINKREFSAPNYSGNFGMTPPSSAAQPMGTQTPSMEGMGNPTAALKLFPHAFKFGESQEDCGTLPAGGRAMRASIVRVDMKEFWPQMMGADKGFMELAGQYSSITNAGMSTACHAMGGNFDASTSNCSIKACHLPPAPDMFIAENFTCKNDIQVPVTLGDNKTKITPCVPKGNADPPFVISYLLERANTFVSKAFNPAATKK